MGQDIASEEKNIFNIEDLLISVCAVFIVGFIALSSTSKPFSTPSIALYLVSLHSFTVTLLLTFWNKFRQYKRQQLFKILKPGFSDELKKDLEALEALNRDNMHAFVGNYYLENNDLLKKDPFKFYENLKEKLKDAKLDTIPKHLHRINEVISVNIVSRYAAIREKAFDSKLEEKNAELKFWIEILARKARYLFFILGVVTFIVAVFVSLI